MKFSDILDLARQGYKPSDIRELLSMDTEPDPKPDTKSETKSEPETGPETKPEPDNETETKSEPDNEPETKSEPDYKKMYEDTLKKLESLQKANQRQPVEEHKDTVNDIIREVFY